MQVEKLSFPVAAYLLLCSVGSYLARNRCPSIAWRLGTPEERNQGETIQTALWKAVLGCCSKLSAFRLDAMDSSYMMAPPFSSHQRHEKFILECSHKQGTQDSTSTCPLASPAGWAPPPQGQPPRWIRCWPRWAGQDVRLGGRGRRDLKQWLLPCKLGCHLPADCKISRSDHGGTRMRVQLA